MTNRPYFPQDPAAQLAWGDNFAVGIGDFVGQLPGVTYPAASRIAAARDLLEEAGDYLANAQALAERRAADREAAAWGAAGKPHKILPDPDFTGPISAKTVDGGLFPLIFACVDAFINDDTCTDWVKTALRLHPLTVTEESAA